MSWYDFFYISSSGDRRALIVLFCLIAVAGGILSLTEALSTGEEEVVAGEVLPDSVRTSPPAAVTEKPASPPSVSTGRKKAKESVLDQVKRSTANKPPAYARTKKLAAGSVVELNAADTLALKMVPGIGTVYANRIVKFRRLLGGFYSVKQLGEVYDIDEDKYAELAPWFRVDTSLVRRLPVNTLPADSLRKHPYISNVQARAIVRLRKQKKRLDGWENLILLKEFSEQDRARLEPYLSFEP
ncbi:MAG: helix-hairpin-helix domain-containing protein [Tannerella sp.]|jgi:DNA uptake protein ComE-like DNA-binding protein|nr:helix-hairpin-helix domain-containing protein [Tannerella sp.]